MNAKILCPRCTEEKRLLDKETGFEVLGEIDNEGVRIRRYGQGSTIAGGPYVKFSCGNPEHKEPVFTIGAKPIPKSRINTLATFLGHMYSDGIEFFLKDLLALQVYTSDELIQLLQDLAVKTPTMEEK